MKSFVIALALVTAAGATHAQDKTPSAPVLAPEVAQPTTAPEPIALEDLASLNGRQGSTSTILSDQDLTAVNRGNTITANSVGSGQITLGAGAFDGFAGVGNFVINSGHNNNLQGALTINIIAPQ